MLCSCKQCMLIVEYIPGQPMWSSLNNQNLNIKVTKIFLYSFVLIKKRGSTESGTCTWNSQANSSSYVSHRNHHQQYIKRSVDIKNRRGQSLYWVWDSYSVWKENWNHMWDSMGFPPYLSPHTAYWDATMAIMVIWREEEQAIVPTDKTRVHYGILRRASPFINTQFIVQ